VNAGLPPRTNPSQGRAHALPTASRSLPQPAGASPRPAGAPLRPALPPAQPVFPARRWRETSGGAGAVKEKQGVSFFLDRRSPPGRYTFIPPGRAGVFCCLGAPGGRTGVPAPRAASEGASRSASTGTARGGRGAKAAMGAARRPWKPAGLKPEHSAPSYAQRSGALLSGGVCGGSAPACSSNGWQPCRAGVATRGTPARRFISAAVPRVATKAIAALTARAASGAGRTSYRLSRGTGEILDARQFRPCGTSTCDDCQKPKVK